MANNDSEQFEYDETNPAKTISGLAGVDEREIEEILTHLSLTEYVALITAIQNKDDTQITEIIDKNIEKQDSVEEALDFNTKTELQKMVPKLPKTPSLNKPKTVMTSTTPVLPNTATTSTIGTKTTTSTIAPTTSSSISLNEPSIVSADSKTGTIAIKDPKNNKVTTASVKDPKNTDEIKNLMKRSGITGIV
jgi:hypothetical protein